MQQPYVHLAGRLCDGVPRMRMANVLAHLVAHTAKILEKAAVEISCAETCCLGSQV